ncbi:hypothetical protein DFH28DRAFT_1126276 [Melampsora americana]|nr:hypothetical protein DFH28DRAFT_1126276 [Melampsora americana]
MIGEQFTSGNLPNSLTSSYSQSVPEFIGRRRSHKTLSQLTSESNHRRCGLVFFDQDLDDHHESHSENSMESKLSKVNWLRGQYSDCWWVSNFKEDNLREKKCPASPLLGRNSASTASDDLFPYARSNDDSYSSIGLGTPSSTQSTACNSFASRKTFPLRTPCNKMITYFDEPLPPPKCPLPALPHSDHPYQSSPVTQHTSTEKSKVHMNFTSSTNLPKYLRRPISFITPKPRESSPTCSARVVTSPSSSDINPRPCITPDLKRLGNSSTYSFILPKSDLLKSSGKRWKINRSTASRFRFSPPSQTVKERRSSLGSLTDDPFRADPLVIYKYQPSFTPINSSASDQDESSSPRTDRILHESSERSISPSTNPSSICELPDSGSFYHSTDPEKSISTNQTVDQTTEVIKEKDQSSFNFPETFVFAPLSRLDGFFNTHPRRRSGIPSKAFTLQISPGPSKTSFQPGDQLKLGILLGHQQFDEIRVNLIGTITSTRGDRVLHEFLKLEEKLIEDREEIELRIPLKRSCVCDECEKEKGVLPDSLVNENVFVSYHLNVKGIKKARWSRDEKVQVSLMVKSNHLSS